MSATLEPLPKPYEFLELQDGQKFNLEILDYLEGVMTITPRLPNPQIPKQITALRVFVERDPALPGLEYFDISSQTLIYQLAPMLDEIIKGKKTVQITAFGVGVKKRFTVAVL